MWKYLIRIILRQRLMNLIIIGVITVFMAWMATKVKLSYEMLKMLPASDSTSIQYEEFKKLFGQDGSVMFVGIQDKDPFRLDHFNQLFDLTTSLKNIDGVEEVLSPAKIFRLVKNENTRKFDFIPVVATKPTSQQEVDSIRKTIISLPFYEGLLYNSRTNVSLLAITLDKSKLNTKSRVKLVMDIRDSVNSFSTRNQLKAHFSGLPYIRTITSKKIQDELKMFLLLALVVAAFFLAIFFKSVKTVVIPLLVVAISVTWALGTVALFGYKITILTGIIPPLLIVIGVENCIFLLNKYQTEYLKHGNKTKALARAIHRIGHANLLTNLATAVGFASFIPTGNHMLIEFGIIASLNIILEFALSLVLIPILFSYLKPPSSKHLKHLEHGPVKMIVDKVVHVVQENRKIVYITTTMAVMIGIYGVTRLSTSGSILDDIPKKDPLYQDLMFLEKHFRGVMPFEISIDTKKKRGVLKLSTIQKIDELQNVLEKYPEFSKPLSVAEVVKFARQSFYNGNPAMYDLPNDMEKNFILSYLPKTKGKRTILDSFIDSTMQITRISVQMANIGTPEIQRIKEDLKPKIDKIFPPEDFKVTITGTSVVFLQSTNYLVKDLMMSLVLAIVVISAIMALLFSSFRMILISLVPNLIPQVLTAAMMGYFQIPIKPSTILIFSIALGISVDNTIQFLSRYRLALRAHNWRVRDSVIAALRETSFSMIYSSSVLFFGFAIFIFSSFGGTQAIGYLISFTLFVALLCNLFVIPSLLLTLDKWTVTKGFNEPILEHFDDDSDIELDDLEIERRDKSSESDSLNMRNV